MPDGEISLDHFTDAAVREQPILEFAKRVHLEFNPDLADSSEGRPSKVEVRLKDGKIIPVRRIRQRMSAGAPFGAGNESEVR